LYHVVTNQPIFYSFVLIFAIFFIDIHSLYNFSLGQFTVTLESDCFFIQNHNAMAPPSLIFGLYDYSAHVINPGRHFAAIHQI